MRIRASYLAAALALAFAPAANATIVGSTYNFTTSVTGNTQISPLGGPTLHTDPANPGFCVGPPVACSTGSGVSGSFAFAPGCDAWQGRRPVALRGTRKEGSG